MSRCVAVVIFALSVLFTLSPSAYPQVDAGVILGTVTDQSGAVIPNAPVSLLNEGTGFTATTQTDASGVYTFPPVRVGSYTVTVAMKGFAESRHVHVTVDIQQKVVVDFTLQPAAVTEKVVVTGQAEVLQTQDASVGQVVGSRAINDLPLNGRNYTFLAQLDAGVTLAQWDNHNADNNGRFVANGTTSQEDNYLLDGMDNNSGINTKQSGHDYVMLTPVDALSEFKIQTNDYSAEFGHSAGAVVNATLKSGTNQLHGDAWEFVRNNIMDSNDFFQNAAGLPIPAYRRNQFGFTLGGPVVIPHVYDGRNRTFFFADYEGTRIIQGKTYVSSVPTAAEANSGYTDFSDLIPAQTGSRTDILGRTYPSGTIFDPNTTRPETSGVPDPVTGLMPSATGFVRDPFPGNVIPAGRLDPHAVAILALLPLPNGPGLFNNYTSSPTWVNNTNAFDGRVDKIISDKDQMFVRYSYSHLIRNQPGPFPGYADGGSSRTADLDERDQSAIIAETHSFSPTVVNEFRVGFVRDAALFHQPYDDQLGIPAQFGIQGIPQFAGNGGLPIMFVGDYPNFGQFYFLPSFKWSTTPQGTDDLTLIHHSHTFKMGVVVQTAVRTPTIQPPFARGALTASGVYTSVVNQTDGTAGPAQFVLAPTPGTYANGGWNSVDYSNTVSQDMIKKNLGAYFQDNWKATRRLTLNLGVRWDYPSFPACRNGACANFDPAPGFASGTYYVPKEGLSEVPAFFTSALAADNINLVGTSGNAVGVDSKKNFAPRVGLAYQLTPKLVVRAGYGIFFEQFEENGATPAQDAYPFENAVGASNPTSVDWITPNTPTDTIGPLETTLADFSLNPDLILPADVTPIGYQYHYKTGYVQSDNLSFQYQLATNSSLTVAYVGSLGRHLPTYGDTINPVGQLLPPGTNAIPYLAYPNLFYGSSYINTPGASSYNALQITYLKQFSHGLSMNANYTWEKTRTDTVDPTDNDQNVYRAPWLPGMGFDKDWFLADFNVPRMIHFSGTYELPFGTGRAFVNTVHGVASQFVSGWNINWIATVQDGQPFSVPCATATSSGGFSCNALTVPGVNKYAGPHNANQFANPLAFVTPPVVTTVGQTDLTPLGGSMTQGSGPPFRRLDFSLFKQFQLNERSHLEFRAEIFNLTNLPNFQEPGNLNYLNTVSFAQISSTRDNPNDPREIQLSLKLYW